MLESLCAREPQPVFVDASGRRERRLRVAGGLVVPPAVSYVVVLLSAALVGPMIHLPFLPPPSPRQVATDSSRAQPAAQSLTSPKVLYLSPRHLASTGAVVTAVVLAALPGRASAPRHTPPGSSRPITVRSAGAGGSEPVRQRSTIASTPTEFTPARSDTVEQQPSQGRRTPRTPAPPAEVKPQPANGPNVSPPASGRSKPRPAQRPVRLSPPSSVIVEPQPAPQAADYSSESGVRAKPDLALSRPGTTFFAPPSANDTPSSSAPTGQPSQPSR